MFNRELKDVPKKNEEKSQQLPLLEKPFRKRERTKEESKGSRWAGLIFLAITMILSFLFSLKGQLPTFDMQRIFGTQTYRFEK